MKSYLSNSRLFREFEAYVFDKLDGSNLRFEWHRKRGWCKYGTRHRLFDESDPVFGMAITQFHNEFATGLSDIFKSERYESAVAFCEFWGPNSFAGNHDSSDVKNLTLFDVSSHRTGLLGPREFLKLYGHMNIPKFLGKANWTRGFVERVYNGEVDGVTFEGVVGKAKESKHDLIMAKAKSRIWIDKVRSVHGAAAELIINS